MRYLIKGTLDDYVRPLRADHEEFIRIIRTKIVPSLRMLLNGQAPGKLLGGGFRAGSSEIYMIVDFPPGDSHACVRRLTVSLPFDMYFRWKVIPLETYEETVGLYPETSEL